MKNFTDEKTTVAELKAVMARFVAEREWNKYHDPKNLSMSIAIEAAELMEIFQWLKNEEAVALRNDPDRYQHIREEVSDIVLYCLSLSNILDIDLSKAISEKVTKNEQKYPSELCRGDYKKPHKQR